MRLRRPFHLSALDTAAESAPLAVEGADDETVAVAAAIAVAVVEED